jgi:PhzF family phenazine biosynthesis protein
MGVPEELRRGRRIPLGDPIFHVDAFTERPFAGNPAAVCLLSSPREDAWRQGIAAEMNLAETAFLERAGSDWTLRWFTPTVEVDLCGHATLASAHVLWEQGMAKPGTTIAFHTRSGLLSAAARGGMIELDFPAEPATAGPAPAELLAALSVTEARSTGRNRLDYLIEVDNEATVRSLVPDFRAIAAACGSGRGVIVTAKSASPEHDFVSRYFAPAAGIDEDPVTGSTHCCLGPFWGDKLGKTELSGFQASSRGGTVRVRLAGERVFLGGHAVTVARGELA